MKKTTLALAVAIASFATVANASLPDNSWYTGARLGWSKYYDTKSENVPGTDKVSDNGIGGGAFVGYQANPYLAFELGYDWLGDVKYKAADSSSLGKLNVQGIGFTGKLSYPLSFISNDLDAYARAGAFIHHTKWKENGESYSDTDVAPVYALGLDYRVSEDFSTRLEYQWVNQISNDSNRVRPDNALLSLGVTYRLGTVTKPAKTEVQEKRFVLNEDILFAYGKETLKEEGSAKLDDLVSSLAKLNPEESAILVVGHADRIGSASYNQKLSEKRAKSVMGYLVSKGISADLISAKGVGKSEPVTGEQCNSVKGAALKACLSPDRRVEIEVKAKTLEEVQVAE